MVTPSTSQNSRTKALRMRWALLYRRGLRGPHFGQALEPFSTKASQFPFFGMLHRPFLFQPYFLVSPVAIGVEDPFHVVVSVRISCSLLFAGSLNLTLG